MPKVLTGVLSAKDLKIGIIASRFNHWITQQLVQGALDTLHRSECCDEDILLIQVPGALEIAPTVKKLLTLDDYDAIICLGAIIQGETSHFEYVASQTSNSIAQLALGHGLPIIFGVLTTQNIEQAMQRSGVKAGNQGSQAALTAIEMANLYQKLEKNHSQNVGFQKRNSSKLESN